MIVVRTGRTDDYAGIGHPSQGYTVCVSVSGEVDGFTYSFHLWIYMPERLADNVWLLDLGWPAPLGANVYLIDDGDVTLVDTGLPVPARRFRREIESTGLYITDIDQILITHYDLDHVGGLTRLAAEIDVPVYMGAADLDIVLGIANPPLLHHKGMFHRGLRSLYQLPESLSFRKVLDQDRIGGFTAYHTPGHNPGHTVYLHSEHDIGLLGDLVWAEDGMLTTPIWLDSYDMRVIESSIRQFVSDAPPFELAGVGHGRPLLSGGFDALEALVEQFEDRYH